MDKREENKILAEIAEQKTIMDSVPAWIFYKDAENRFIKVNKTYADVVGLPKEELEGKSVFDLYSREQAEAYWRDDLEVIRSGQPKINIVEPVETRNGKIWVKTQKIPYRDGQGKIVGIIGFAVEITECVKAEEEMAFKAVLLEAQAEASQDGILVVDSSGKALSFNRRFGEMWEIPPEIIETRNDEKMLEYAVSKLAAPEKFMEKVQYLYARPEEKSKDEIAFKDGRVFERYSAPLLDKSGKNYGRVWFFRDISERRRMEKLKEEFLRIASHELRVPLASIKQAIYLIISGTEGKVSQEQRKILEIAEQSIDHLNAVVANLLDESKMEAGRLALNKELANVNEIIIEEAKIFELQAVSRNMQLENELNLDLPLVNIDAGRISEVLGNLINNAIKFSPPGGRIRISSSFFPPEKKAIQVSVKDSGAGIAADDMEKLFKKYEQLGIARPDMGHGTGLGLVICKQIVELHGGIIWAESAGPGKGACFNFTLPLE